MLLPLGIVTDMGLAVETMVGYSRSVRGLDGVVTVPTVYVREVHTRNHFAGVVPLDQVGHTCLEAVDVHLRDVKDQRSILHSSVGEGIDLYVVSAKGRVCQVGYIERYFRNSWSSWSCIYSYPKRVRKSANLHCNP